MPSTMTHTFFAKDVYKNLPKTYQNKINLEYLKIFAQGSDPFMFYNFLIGKKAAYYKNIQPLMHTSKTQDFFINLVKYITDNNLTTNEQVLSFLYGYIAHYYLDSLAHPYITYKTGVFNRHDKTTYKYNAKHQEMEYNIDLYLIDKYEKTNHKTYPIHKEIFSINTFSPELTNAINYTIEKTYNIKNITPIYLKSLKNMKTFFQLFNYDPYGIKKNIYTIIDFITPQNVIKIKELSYHNEIITDYLNLDKKIWINPYDKNEISHDSFNEIYNHAQENTINTIIKISNYLATKEITITKLKTIFPNNSYVTGKNCNLTLTPKYFESKKLSN